MAIKRDSKLQTFLNEHFNEFSQSNKERIRALYSDFTQLSIINKYAFDLNIKFWRQVILDVSQQGYLGSSDSCLIIDRLNLSEKFMRPQIGRPLSMDLVLDYMKKKGELMTQDEFCRKYNTQSGWLDWLYDRNNKHKWALLPTGDDKDHSIVMPTLKAIAKAIMNHRQKTNAEPLSTLTQFRSLYCHHFMYDLELTDTDITLLLRYLYSEYGISIMDSMKGYNNTYTVIKFPLKEKVREEITEQDQAIISIRTSCQAITTQIQELQHQIENLSKQSREEHHAGHKSIALYCIKKKMNIEKIIAKKVKVLETMDTILMKIESSKDNMQIVEAFNIGADVLRDILEDDKLSVESVNDVMDKVQSTLDDTKEVEDAMHFGLEDNFSDTEYDELNELISSNKTTVGQSFTNKSQITTEPPNQSTNTDTELKRLNDILTPNKDPSTQKEKQLHEPIM
ncbi:Snf7-domain-containing protein [Pilobolus umbonatus]|nr:Snf7-domain-containing protein [Pilobolus umbonatus]